MWVIGFRLWLIWRLSSPKKTDGHATTIDCIKMKSARRNADSSSGCAPSARLPTSVGDANTNCEGSRVFLAFADAHSTIDGMSESSNIADSLAYTGKPHSYAATISWSEVWQRGPLNRGLLTRMGDLTLGGSRL